MNVYLLVEETDQSEFTYSNESAEPVSSIVGVYGDRDKAEREKERLDRENTENAKKLDADSYTYFIEERPVL